ncbi:hypothetical protein FT663_03081 [Candidozyma haemuli var. vulneris]|uniref:Uncharacterized protein n=1 Tax=Candidozyma haemuli TaxID=45357 RepID=A0A2V1ATF6_9ASCO|nr:hypothetical protein CXQ85_000084 [[Candida] haemuloni]KAF3989328.1 hypothetical protein FT662_02879 [[Candida] haemuloni var. vulneris]KAF3990635.1 hypothetical protein FT663_03081 [[Candida] haemuloni var. vulneris]PVH21119.1 hypothetical protein CXQ85_000084 [[Candida] haemuloni]
MSSPSRSVIDPLIYSYPDNGSSSSSSSGSGSEKKKGDSLPPASKLISNAQSTAPPTTGWTPMVSKTLSAEMISHNSTPNTKVLPGFYRQTTASGSMPTAGTNDMDFPVLNLTPFLTHNLNFLNNQNSAGNPSSNVNFTPFYDKSMHLTDFFIDSPLRPSPSKAVETITPSRFAMSSERKSLSHTLDATTSTKRSIGQIDTPARHPFKKYDSQVDDDSETDNEDDENKDDKPYEDNFVTPSKKNVLKETSGNLLNKTPLNQTPLASKKNKNVYQTPAKPTQMSSPSTVIMSSVNKSPEESSSKANIVPPSPTPNKERGEGTTAINSEPVMGIFSERKLKPMAAEPPKPAKKNNKKNSNGTSKFQIVFTDVHTLMNSKKKKEPELKDSKSKRGQDKSSQMKNRNNSQRPSQRNQRPMRHQQEQAPHQHHQQLKQDSPHLHQQNLQQQPPPTFAFQHTSSSLSASQDYNSTMNSSREFSMLGVNSSQNTTGANLNFSATEHTSFELNNAGMASTPNRKYLLDNSFDKASPQAINQMTSSFHQVQVRQMEEHHQEGMPPPKHLTLQHAAQQALRNPDQSHPPQMGMNMMMSTPQHSSINNNAFMAEDSPSNREPMALLYQHLHQYEQAMQPNEPGHGHK